MATAAVGTIVTLILALLAVFVRCERCENSQCTTEINRLGRCVPSGNCPDIQLMLTKVMKSEEYTRLSALASACGNDVRRANFLVCCEYPKSVQPTPPSSTTSKPTRPRPPTTARRALPAQTATAYNLALTARPTQVTPTHPTRSPVVTPRPTPSRQNLPFLRMVLPTACGTRPVSYQIWSEVEDIDHVHVWAVLLNITLSDSTTGRCVGTMITDRYVLTAAHCISSVHVDDVMMYYGLVGTSEWPACLMEDVCQERRPVDFIVHDGYNELEKTNDIALIRAEDPVQATGFIGPICLPLNHTFDESDPSGSPDVVAVGWGRTVGDILHSDKKKLAHLRVLRQDECAKDVRVNATVLASMMCTLGYQRGQDVCSGDSGAPLIQDDKKLMYVVGVASYGPVCGTNSNRPGKAMRVSHYLNWILATIRLGGV